MGKLTVAGNHWPFRLLILHTLADEPSGIFAVLIMPTRQLEDLIMESLVGKFMNLPEPIIVRGAVASTSLASLMKACEETPHRHTHARAIKRPSQQLQHFSHPPHEISGFVKRTKSDNDMKGMFEALTNIPGR